MQNLTPAGKDALVRAGEEARRLGHDYVSTEHILLALLEEPYGPAEHVLGELGVLERAREKLAESWLRPGAPGEGSNRVLAEDGRLYGYMVEGDHGAPAIVDGEGKPLHAGLVPVRDPSPPGWLRAWVDAAAAG